MTNTEQTERLTAYLGDTPRESLWTGPVIDCDVHANVPSLQTLFPYMEKLWVDWTRERGWIGPRGAAAAYPPNLPTTARPEWRPDDRPPASDLTLLQHHVLDPWNAEHAVVNCCFGIESLRHPDWAAAVVRALNDWLIAEWLDKDKRLVGSMVVPARDPAAMVKEIERVGSDPRIVQVLFPVRSEALYGQRIWHPVYAALCKHDLVLGLHWGGTTVDAPSSTGYASWFAEEYGAEWQSYAAQVTSLVAEGVFRAYPDLRVAVLEGGFTWLPGWGWRMNKEWKGLRGEVPWLDAPPLDVIRKHMRFSTAPIDAGPPEHMSHVLEWLGSDDLLMFATDYPHLHDDDVATFLEVVPERMKKRMMSESAREWYRL